MTSESWHEKGKKRSSVINPAQLPQVLNSNDGGMPESHLMQLFFPLEQ